MIYAMIENKKELEKYSGFKLEIKKGKLIIFIYYFVINLLR